MLWRPTHYKRLVQLADGLTTAVSLVLSYFVWDMIRVNTNLAVGQPIHLHWDYLLKILGFSFIWVVILNKLKAYTYRSFTSLRREFLLVFKTIVIGTLIFFAAFFIFRFRYIPRTYIFIFAVINFICLACEKLFLFRIIKIIRAKGKGRKKLLVVGTGNKAVKFVNTVEKNLGWGLDIIGFLSNGDHQGGKTLLGKEILGTFSEVNDILHKNIIDEVIICISDKDFAAVKKVLEACEEEGVRVRLNSDFFGCLAKKVSVDHIYGLPIVSFSTTPDNEWVLYLKRLVDIVVSALALIILLPLLIVIAILIKLTSKGAVFYEWNVIGLNKKHIKSWKFRTMVCNADKLKDSLMEKNEMTGPVFKIENDPRITKVGRLLRKFSLDEFPQLWSVLKGDLSLVGPRPAGPHELERYEHWHRRKLSIKPGLTCLWQVNGRNKISDFDEWVRLDLEYIDNWSLWLDLKILLKTIPAVLKGTGK